MPVAEILSRILSSSAWVTRPAESSLGGVGVTMRQPLGLRLRGKQLASLSRVGLAKSLIFAPEPVTDGFWTRAGGFLSMRPASIVAAARELKAIPRELPSMMARYPALSVPVGVLFGDEDVVLDPNAQGPAFCASVPGAELTVVEGGHMLPLSQPKVAEAFIRKLLARVSAPPIPQGETRVLH